MSDTKREVASAMESKQQFCLRWNDHQNTLVTIFESLLDSNILVDCTLAAEGQCLKAHKIVLCACSPYFQLLLREHTDKHPIIILKDVKFVELKAMIEYMYRGEVNIPQDQLGPLLKAAETLQIRGLGFASNQDGSGRSEKSSSFHKGMREKEQVSQRSGTSSPPPRPLSSGAVNEILRSNQNAALRRGSESPTPRKRIRHLRPADGSDGQSPTTSSDPPPQNHPPLLPDTSSVPSLALLSNQPTVPTRSTEWSDLHTERTASHPTPSMDDVPPLAPLSSFSDVARESSGDRKWSELGIMRSSAPSEANGSGTASENSEKLLPLSEILLVPKTECVEVEDDDDSLTNAMLEDVQDMEASGPSHIDGSSGSAAFVPWLENIGGVVDEATEQDLAVAYRASQGSISVRKGNTCCSVAGCTTSYRNTEKSVKFYRFPARKHDLPLRQLWIDCINTSVGFKKPWQPTKYSRICSKHFVGNRKSFDPRSPSYVPTVFT